MTDPEPIDSRSSRRRLLIAALGLAGAYAGLRFGVPAASERLRSLAFEPLEHPQGFRRLVTDGGVSSRAFDPFIGLGGGGEPVTPSCTGLFEATSDPDRVPIAYFSDYNCTYCRIIGPRLAALDGVRIKLHEWPLLGEGSTIMARAALAAGQQDAHDRFHHALMRVPLPSPARITRIVEDLGLDGARLLADMNDPEVQRTLDRSAAVAAYFGFYATPSLVVGRTAVIGAVSEVTLARLVERERADGPMPDRG